MLGGLHPVERAHVHANVVPALAPAVEQVEPAKRMFGRFRDLFTA